MPDFQIQRYEEEKAGDLFDADVWIEDAKLSLGDVMSQAKEWRDNPKLAAWCTSVRTEASNVVDALDKLQAAIKKQPKG